MGILPMQMARRRTHRAPVNPLDKSTIVSIYPREINEIKHTIEPGRFLIPAGTYDKPAILVVGPSSWWKEIDEEQPLLEIPNSSIQVADSVVKDYANGLLASNVNDTMPGLFWVPGAFTVAEIKKDHKNLLDAAKAKQDKWFLALIRLADGMWARSGGNPLTISDDMRMAAREFGLNGKDWMKDFAQVQQSKCPACGTLRNPDYPICAHCHAIIDKDKAKAMGIEFANTK